MEKPQTKKTGARKVLSIMGRIAFLLAVLFLIAYLFSILTESKEFFNASAQKSAMVTFDEDLEKAEGLATKQYDDLYAIADRVENATSQKEVTDVLEEYIGVESMGALRFYSQGKGYDASGSLIEKETYGHEEISALALSNEQGCTDIYYDDSEKLPCIAFFVPVRGSAFVDGLLSIVPVRRETNTVPIISAADILSEGRLGVLIVDGAGKVYSSALSEDLTPALGGDLSVGNELNAFIAKLSDKIEDRQAVLTALAEHKKSACSVQGIDGEYVFVFSPIEGFGGHLSLVTMTEQEGLIAPEMSYVRYIINLTIIAIVSLTVGMVYAFMHYRDSKSALEEAIYTDPIVGCANAEKFRSLAGKIIQEGQRIYAIAVFEIRQFRYLEEKLPPDDTSEILKHVSKVISTFCHPRETYGYLGEGRFVLLTLYHGDSSIRDRAKLLSTVLSKHPILGASKSKKLFNVGVSLVFDNKRYTVQELINHAGLACESAKNNVNLPFVVYNEEVNAEREHNDRIEMEMESALAGGEFRLFLQPKYNVVTDRIDSAEALVRWFDPKTGDYRFPGEFISLFESNGFITKLDHFMYLEVLKWLQQATERGEKQVPISVNVSLVTANASDFLPFYIDNKKKYGIPDNFITIEFTEGFLVDDYQKLNEIVERLHRNGIRCSLDDFGTGYASFNALKNVPFDELKLDRTLLESGFNKKQDDMVLGTVVSLAKSLGMKVVQEGVETKAVFDKVIELGCDVVQGYYYAKAIPAEEYKLFLASNTSIKYKSLVK